MKRLFSFLLVLLAAASVFAAELRGKCVRVSDGDTVTVEESEGCKFKVRLAAIDAPEKAQAFGKEAKAKLESLLLGKPVVVTFRSVDRYGRLIGSVTADGKDAAKEMLRGGFAWHYAYFDSDKENAELETFARVSRAGLWRDPEPVAPWVFRQKKAEAEKDNIMPFKDSVDKKIQN